ncbi:hypothetical protein ACOVH1_004529 [Klebsiella pneumoniae]|uniref:hypothetical protein n=1 Tax=Klebsiella TaxID=570 RepID=UPI000C7DF1AC|nr:MULTISPECIES: hypothetical protein [Klebsiella]HAT3953361.1 hypothetical protein [Kluyvera ascorbata]HDS8978562.1 hypothetical protein [Raoultella ornithinolytica]HDS9255968.1 hypothetical protein [Klebsiella pneumoniae subsp. pneumoniae]HDU4944829.1 hypothetical protein [Klebsiella pneumoniae subsp. ozaenae]MBG2015635.1 hypothetical protein [Klebsiella pneumoniae]
MIDKCTALTATQNEPEDKPEQLPVLTRFYKNRARNSEIMQKCKHMLIAGYSPQRVSCLLRLPLEKVQELYDNSYNPRCRRFAKTNAYTNAKLALTSFNEGADLVDIAAALGLSLYWVVTSLRQNGVTDAAMAPRMPPYEDKLYVEYRRVVARKAASKSRPICINPVRRTSKHAGQTASPR